MEEKDYKITIPAHPSVYDPKPRELDIFFSEPSGGINEETGLLLLIAGFGGHAESRVYKKMRRLFADQYNLVTIQCNYFGFEFMQDPTNMNIDLKVLRSIFNAEEMKRIYNDGKIYFHNLLDYGSKYEKTVKFDEILEESPANFNDMGVMQAVDCITALLVVIEILKDNKYSINMGKIITYGHSHGAYLSYLCNSFCPGLISLIIDNSAWLLPQYLIFDRFYYYDRDKFLVKIYYKYMAKKVDVDKKIRDLDYLYKKKSTDCNIICYQGTKDKYIDQKEKMRFINRFAGSEFIVIDDSKIDGIMFKSTGHGLGADFIRIFEHSMNDFDIFFKYHNELILKNCTFVTNKAKYSFTYDTGVPLLQVVK